MASKSAIPDPATHERVEKKVEGCVKKVEPEIVPQSCLDSKENGANAVEKKTQLEETKSSESEEITVDVPKVKVSDNLEEVGPNLAEISEQKPDVSAAQESATEVVEKPEEKLELSEKVSETPAVSEPISEVGPKIEEQSEVSESVADVLEKSEKQLEVSPIPESLTDLVRKTAEQSEVSAGSEPKIEAEEKPEISGVSESAIEVAEKTEEVSKTLVVSDPISEVGKKIEGQFGFSQSVPEVVEKSEEQSEALATPESLTDLVGKSEEQSDVSASSEPVIETDEKPELSAISESAIEVADIAAEVSQTPAVSEPMSEVGEKIEEHLGASDSVPEVAEKSEEQLVVSAIPESSTDVVRKTKEQSELPASLVPVIEAEEKPEIAAIRELEIQVVEKSDDVSGTPAVSEPISEVGEKIEEQLGVFESVPEVVDMSEEQLKVSASPESSTNLVGKTEEQSNVTAGSEPVIEAEEKPEISGVSESAIKIAEKTEEVLATAAISKPTASSEPVIEAEEKPEISTITGSPSESGEVEKKLDALVTEENIKKEISNGDSKLDTDMEPLKTEEASEEEKEHFSVYSKKVEDDGIKDQETITKRDLGTIVSSDQLVQPKHEFGETAIEGELKGAKEGLDVSEAVQKHSVDAKIKASSEDSKKVESGNGDGVEGVSKVAAVEINTGDTASVTEVAKNLIKSEDMIDNIASLVDTSKDRDGPIPVTELAEKVDKLELPVKPEEFVETVADNIGTPEEEAKALGDAEGIEEGKKEEMEKSDAPNLALSCKEGGNSKTDDDVPKQEATAKSNRQSNNIISKVKQSMVKVKKAILGKSQSSKTLTSDAKDDIRVK